MGTIISKRKGKNGNLYWYYVESGRVDGKPRIVNQVYLGTAAKVAELVTEGSRPTPLSATARAWGLPGAAWLAAIDSGLWDCLLDIWPEKQRSGPGVAHYLLLSAIHRLCSPGPKTEVANWYSKSVLRRAWGFKPSRFTSQAFWDAFDSVDLDSPFPEDDLSRAQLAALRLWSKQGLIQQRVLAYDSTNFHTYIDTKNERCSLAQRGHSKQGHNNLKQIGLSYVMDGSSGIGLFHHTYPGNRADAEEFSISLPFILEFFDRADIPRSDVTLVFDKGSASMPNSLQLAESGIGWVAAVPWNQASEEIRSLPESTFSSCGPTLPGVRWAEAEGLVQGQTRRCVVMHSSTFQAEQLHSLMGNISKACAKLRTLSRDLDKPQRRARREQAVRTRIAEILAHQWLKSAIEVELAEPAPGTFSLQFRIDNEALTNLVQFRLGRTVLTTTRAEWEPDAVIKAYHGQEAVERSFRSLKQGAGPSWGPAYHWTDSKIRVHSFCCVLAMSLLNWLHAKVRKANLDMTTERMVAELGGLQEIVVLYPSRAATGPKPTTTVDTRETLDQIQLIEILELGRLRRP